MLRSDDRSLSSAFEVLLGLWTLDMQWVYHGYPILGSVQSQMRWGFGASLVGDVPWGLELIAFKVPSDPTHAMTLDADGREKRMCFHSVLVLHGRYEIPGGMFTHRGGCGVFWKHHHSGLWALHGVSQEWVVCHVHSHFLTPQPSLLGCWTPSSTSSRKATMPWPAWDHGCASTCGRSVTWPSCSC